MPKTSVHWIVEVTSSLYKEAPESIGAPSGAAPADVDAAGAAEGSPAALPLLPGAPTALVDAWPGGAWKAEDDAWGGMQGEVGRASFDPSTHQARDPPASSLKGPTCCRLQGRHPLHTERALLPLSLALAFREDTNQEEEECMGPTPRIRLMI